MKKKVIQLSLFLFAMGIGNILNAQVSKDILNWYNGKAGMQTEKAYKKLKKRQSETVVVAVIDSGIDIEHEDLKGRIWVNEDEIPGNGIDDDKNGYIDDVHGWNFIGGKDGNVDADTYEVTREYVRLKDKYENFDEKKLNKKNRDEYE